ncbi:MAG: complex I NDUFA9 subunit family protein [Chloroflexi bacterium]|nr:complex I NDUFA9 subunit family protein [Chloroflexota bacterium]
MMVLLTGATGFVGQRVARWLVGMGHQVRCLVRRTADLTNLQPLRVEIWHGDVTDPASLPGAFAGVDTVVHLVAIIREQPARGITFQRVNAEGTRHMVAAARQAGVRRFVHMSAIGVRDDPRYPYWHTKWLGEQAVRESGLPSVVLRPSLIFGEGDEFFTTLADLVRKPPSGLFPLAPMVPVPGRGATRFQPIFVEDVGRCFTHLVTEERFLGQVVTIGGPDLYTYEQMLDLVMETLSRRRLKVHLPLALMRPNVWLLERLLPHPPVTTVQLDMFPFDNVAESLDVVERTFGFRPKRLRDEIGYIRKSTAARHRS